MIQNKTVQSMHSARRRNNRSALAVGIARGIGAVLCYGATFGGAMAGLIIVDTFLYITFDAGDAAAIGRTAKIAHNT